MKSQSKPFTVSQYDEIVKENLEAAIPALIERLLHIYPVESKEVQMTFSIRRSVNLML